MGNIESNHGESLGAVDSLKYRLQSLEEAIRSIEVAHQDAQGDHFPPPDSADVCLYGARLTCRPGVRILTGPVIGEVTANSAVILLEIDISPELGSTAKVSCYISLTDNTCPGGRVVSTATLRLPSRRPRVFRFEGGPKDALGPGRTYNVCFGGVSIEDARFRVGRFRTPNTSFGSDIKIIAVSGDRPSRLAPGEPSLWRMLREHITASSSEASPPPIDLVLHTGGQVWMGDAFEDARELLRRRAMEPLLCASGGWREAQEEATECLREAVRRAWNLPDKRAVLSSVANLMLCGAADVHQDLENMLASLPSSTVNHVGGVASKQSLETRALHGAVRACRRVYCEYQGQLFWKAVPSGEGQVEGTLNLTAAFEAEEACVEDILAEAHRAERNVAVKLKKVLIAEEALRRAASAGSLPAEGGRRAAEETIENFRKDAKAAQARRMSLTRRAVPAAAAAAAERACQGAFLSLGGAVAFVFLDTAWTMVRWDGGLTNSQEDGDVSGEAKPPATPLLSNGAWETLEKQLRRDSELRLLIVVMRFALMEEGIAASGAENHLLPNERNSAPKEDNNLGEQPQGAGSKTQRSPSWLKGRDRLLNLIFKWKAEEAWREVVLVCGAETGLGGSEGLRSSCEVEITDVKHPGCIIRQLIAGPITDNPHSVADEDTGDGCPAPRPLVGATDDLGRFSGRLAFIEYSPTSTFARDHGFSSDATKIIIKRNSSTNMTVQAAATPHQQKLEVKTSTGQKAPGWDGGDASDGRGDTRSTDPDNTRASHGTQPSGNALSLTIPRQAYPVSANGERSFLQASLYKGHSPTTAIAAGLNPEGSARGIRPSVVAEAVKLSIAGATVVLGPVVGRVTQRSAVVLLEVGSTAAVGCVLTDGVTGWQHRQMRLLVPGQPHAFFFETLEEQRHYTISLDGVDNADSRTGGFTTLKAWSDRHEPPALRAALRLAAASNGTAASSNVSQSTQEKKERDPTTGSLSPLVARTGSTKHDASGKGQYNDESFVFDMRLVFVSGTGLTARRRGRRAVGGLARPGDVDNDEDGKQTEGGRPPADMWRVLGRELWNPWPQADVVVHTGSQVDLEVAVLEALPLLSAAEAEEEGSDAREEAEGMAMERIRDAYRFQWSLPGARACLSCGSHLMLRGEADLALPEVDLERSLSGRLRGGGKNRDGGEVAAGERQQRVPSPPVSAYARHTLARLASQAFSDYQRQLWDPLSVPMGLDMDDVGYARGGSGVDSIGSGDRQGSFLEIDEAAAAGIGEWHFHVFGETVGLFALDVRQGGAGLQQDQRAPVLSGAQWSSLAVALSIEDIQAMIIVGDMPFVVDSIHDARAKARYPSNAHLRRSWPFHGGELLRLLGMLIEWKAKGGLGGEPREVILIGGGLRYPLETTISDSLASTAITQTICGPFSGAPLQNVVSFELAGQLSRRLSYHHIARGALHAGPHQPSGQSAGKTFARTQTPAIDSTGAKDETVRNTDGTAVIDDRTRDANDSGRRPSCVLVRCKANGAGPSASLLLNSRFFTPASWTAWCNGGFNETPPSAFNGYTKPLPSSLPAEALAPDMGRPRGAPQWAATAGDEIKGSGRRGGTEIAEAMTEAILTALAAKGPTKVLAEAFERVLDIEENDKDETSAANCGGTGDATRRVFDCVAWVYDHPDCSRVRTLCPTRPSPIVIRRFILAQRERDTMNRIAVADPLPTMKPGAPKGTAVGDHHRNKAEASDGGHERKRDTKEVEAIEERGTENVGEGRGSGRLLASPAWLFSSLPFHDDDTFRIFFVDVLQGSGYLAQPFS